MPPRHFAPPRKCWFAAVQIVPGVRIALYGCRPAEGGVYFPITARAASRKERARYQQVKGGGELA